MIRTLVYIIRDDTRKQSITLFDPTGNVGVGQLNFLAALIMSENEHKSVMSIDSGFINTF